MHAKSNTRSFLSRINDQSVWYCIVEDFFQLELFGSRTNALFLSDCRKKRQGKNVRIFSYSLWIIRTWIWPFKLMYGLKFHGYFTHIENVSKSKAISLFCRIISRICARELANRLSFELISIHPVLKKKFTHVCTDVQPFYQLKKMKQMTVHPNQPLRDSETLSEKPFYIVVLSMKHELVKT